MIAKKVNKTSYLCNFIILICFSLFGKYCYSQCPTQINGESIVNIYSQGTSQQNNFLTLIKECLAKPSKLNDSIDDSVVDIFYIIDKQNYTSQQGLVNLTLKLLLINAQSGYAPSEHNYAVVHNAEPNSPLSKLVPQNYKIYIYWTKKAAAQKEPRALFNLAIRMMEKTDNVKYDPKTSYIIFTYLKKHELIYYKAYKMEQYRQRNIALIGKNTAEKLNSNVNSFNFHNLSP